MSGKIWRWGGILFLILALLRSPLALAAPQEFEASGVTIAPELFAEVAEKAIKEELAAKGEERRYELKPLRIPEGIRVPATDLRVEAKVTKILRYDRSVPVSVLIYVKDSLYRRLTVYYTLEVYDTVAVAAHKLPLEKALTAADVRLEERRIPSREEVYVKDSQAVVGKVPARVIREGTLITLRMLQNPLVIEPGSAVKIVAVTNGIRIETEGVALQRGRVGKKIRVRNAKTSKVLQGTVVNDNTVEIRT
ncbi:MAG: flagellar basal body P-ring formation protein FlgA [Selenomonadaceae bacterium]|nr:flagellar basal body P-ring formation protein FlgA [Selenomonadaceae bacterium]